MTNFPKKVTRWQTSDGVVNDTLESARVRELGCRFAQNSHSDWRLIERLVANPDDVIRILGGTPSSVVTVTIQPNLTNPAPPLWAMPDGVPDPPVDDRTIFECRVCSDSVHGFTDGRFEDPQWGRIARIDGPNAICPSCIADPTSLDALREEYSDAHVVTGDGKSGRKLVSR